jgi:hypothetical protein
VKNVDNRGLLKAAMTGALQPGVLVQILNFRYDPRKKQDGRQADALEILNIQRLIAQMIRFDEIARENRYKREIVESAAVGGMGEEARVLRSCIDSFLSGVLIVRSLGAPAKGGWTMDEKAQVSDNCSALRTLLLGTVLKAALEGIIQRIRQCPTCKTWFFARRFARSKHHKFCSVACRQKAFRGDPKRKPMLAEYMRRYRAGLKRRDAENLRVGRRAKRGGK